MPKIADEPLAKVTFNIYQRDLEWYKRYYGQGWSERIRDVLRNHRKLLQSGPTSGEIE